MSPVDLPQWVRDTVPLWASLCVLVWFSLQRFLDRTPGDTKPQLPAPYDRPTKDPRIIFPTIGFIGVSLIQIATGPAPSTINSQWATPTQAILAVVMILGGGFTIAGAYARSEFRSIGWELIGCILLTGVFAVYFWAYTTSVAHWAAAPSVMYALCLLAGNVVRAVQLLKRVG